MNKNAKTNIKPSSFIEKDKAEIKQFQESAFLTWKRTNSRRSNKFSMKSRVSDNLSAHSYLKQ